MAEAPKDIRNEITGGAVVVGGVVQAGTVNGQIHFHYEGERAPLDLLAMRSWLGDVVTDYRARVERDGDRAGATHLKRLDAVCAGLDDSAEANARKDVIRRLLVAGVAAYLNRCRQLPPTSLGEQILLDLVVFSVWPVISARRLPDGWQGDLAALTSPRLAALVERARQQRHSEAEFARTVANKSFARAMLTLCDDLGDPRRGGALLTALTVAATLPAPPTGGAKKVVVWVVGFAGGAAVVDAVLDHGSHLGELLEAVGDLPVDAIDPAELLADLFEGLFG